jgi:hypothetical protein
MPELDRCVACNKPNPDIPWQPTTFQKIAFQGRSGNRKYPELLAAFPKCYQTGKRVVAFSGLGLSGAYSDDCMILRGGDTFELYLPSLS